MAGFDVKRSNSPLCIDFNKIDSSEKASKAIILNPNDQVDLIAFFLTLSERICVRSETFVE